MASGDWKRWLEELAELGYIQYRFSRSGHAIFYHRNQNKFTDSSPHSVDNNGVDPEYRALARRLAR